MDDNANKNNINLWIASKEYNLYQLIIMAIYIIGIGTGDQGGHGPTEF